MRSIWHWAWTSSARESGEALVELAVATSLLVLICLGSVEFGQVAYTSTEVAGSAKAGAQYGAQNGATASDSNGITSAATAAAPNLSGMAVTATYACACSDGSASTCLLTDCPNSHIEESVIVKTSYVLTPIVKIPGLASTLTVTGSSIRECGQ